MAAIWARSKRCRRPDMQFRTQAFPYCPLESEDVGPGTLHPVAVTLQQMADWYWRVKLWQLTVYDTLATLVIPDLQLQNYFTGFVPANERELICGLEKNAQFSFLAEWSNSAIAVYDGIGTLEAFWNFHAFSQGGQPGGALAAGPDDYTTEGIRFHEKLYYPQILFQLFVSSDFETPSDFSTYDPGDPYYTPSSVSLQIDGIEFPLWSHDVTGTTAITLEPQEWWPYAPESDDSLPIYDTGTGKRIRANTVSD